MTTTLDPAAAPAALPCAWHDGGDGTAPGARMTADIVTAARAREGDPRALESEQRSETLDEQTPLSCFQWVALKVETRKLTRKVAILGGENLRGNHPECV